MTTYEELLQEAFCDGAYVIENASFISCSDGLINGDVIGINKKIRESSARSCVLAEELGHLHTSSGVILDLSSTANRKQEQTARLWAYDRLIGLQGIVSGYKAGCRSRYELADHLGVTEEFLQEALLTYQAKYGTAARYDGYVIYFEPGLAVMELK